MFLSIFTPHLLNYLDITFTLHSVLLPIHFQTFHLGSQQVFHSTHFLPEL